MKKQYLISFLLLLLIILVGCQQNNKLDKSASYTTVNDLDGVTMTMKEDSFSTNGGTVILKNTTVEEYIFGDYYFLEVKTKDSWAEVPITLKENYGFNDIGYRLEAETETEWSVDWAWLYGNLKTGQYRIVKDILDVKEPADHNTYYVTAEFTIE